MQKQNQEQNQKSYSFHIAGQLPARCGVENLRAAVGAAAQASGLGFQVKPETFGASCVYPAFRTLDCIGTGKVKHGWQLDGVVATTLGPDEARRIIGDMGTEIVTALGGCSCIVTLS